MVVRWLVLIAVCLVGSMLLVEEAVGHGGRFRSPFPDWGRELSPVPPPPPPPAQPPPPPADGGPVAPPRVTPPAAGRRPLSVDDWSFWWQLNADRYENLKWRIEHHDFGSRPLFVSDWAVPRRRRWPPYVVERFVLPGLATVVDPAAGEVDHVVASALLAIGKLARSDADVLPLLAALDPAAARATQVREAAALGLGLLHRDHKEDESGADVLDAARRALFACLEEPHASSSVRISATLALGLLGDQPTRDGVAGMRRHVDRLLTYVGDEAASAALRGAPLIAIAHHPADAVLPYVRERLHAWLLNRRVGDAHAPYYVRTGAAIVLGRLGDARDVEVLGRVLDTRRMGHYERRSAATALGLLARRVGTAEREQIERILLRALDRARDAATGNLVVISLARVLVADLRSRSPRRLNATRADETLLHLAERGTYLRRGFALLALGMVAREVFDDSESDDVLEWRREALKLLREVATSRSGVTHHTRTAAVLALGMARDSRSRSALLDLFEDLTLSEGLRSAAARAYGMIGDFPYRDRPALHRAVGRDHPLAIRRAALRAHALLGHPHQIGVLRDPVDLVLDELEAAEAEENRADAILLLTHDADRRALLPLVRVLLDRRHGPRSRALAATALGCVGDEEWTLSLDHIRADLSPRWVDWQIGAVLNRH